IIGYVMCIAFIVFYKLCAFEKFPEFSTSSSVFLIAVDLIGISSLYAIQFLDTERNMRNVYSLFVYIALYFIVITIYLSARSICSEKRRYLRAKQENLLIRATNSQIEMTKTNMASFRKMRHDIRNKIGVLLVLNQEKKYDELTRGLTELAGADIVEAGYIDCGNTEISAILTMEQSKAMANGFKLVHTVVVPSRLPFDIMDICSVLANMIDNAIEANLRYGVSDNICVQISIKGKYLYIGVLNKLPENFYKDEILNLSTSKANPEEHGFGVDIIRNISEKYGGFSS
ncbi:MAG TPA: hypothetical protein DDY77_03400, partial [Clostridiales bacterium]|nr:hypothetical protein [Clostridiales bacterium]